MERYGEYRRRSEFRLRFAEAVDFLKEREKMLGGRSWSEWIREYSAGHQNPVNLACHGVGIPMIAVAVLLIPLALWRPQTWKLAGGLFVVGWILQFVGHAFEGKPPEFFKDWRFLFVGLRWWFAKVSAAFARQNEDPG
jgi:uncharacterized membrane protein YGL010W